MKLLRITDSRRNSSKLKINNHLEEDKIIENYPITNNIVFENIGTNNVTTITNENNMATNPDLVPEHNEKNLIVTKLDYFNELLSQNSALSSENILFLLFLINI